MKVFVLSLVAVSAMLLSGCVSTGDAQSDKYDGSLDALRETRHIAVECAIGIDGVKGIKMTIEECNITLETGQRLDASWTCTGLTGNHAGTAYGNLESVVSVGLYTPGGKQYTETLTYDVERGDTATGTCTGEFPTDNFGGYATNIVPTCYEDSTPFWFGFQAKEVPCASFSDKFSVKKEWF